MNFFVHNKHDMHAVATLFLIKKKNSKEYISRLLTQYCPQSRTPLHLCHEPCESYIYI